MKTLGIIGGLGPRTTAELYARINQHFDVESIGHRPHIIIDSIPITTFLENENIIYEREFEPVLPYLVESAKRLKKGGADYIVLACNSLHIFSREISEATKVPFVSIIDVVVNKIKEAGYKQISLLGTYKTNSSKMYDTPLLESGVKLSKLEIAEQADLSKTIIRLINGTYGDNDRELFGQIIAKEFSNGSEAVILACTDFHLISDSTDERLIDTAEELAQYATKLLSAE